MLQEPFYMQMGLGTLFQARNMLFRLAPRRYETTNDVEQNEQKSESFDVRLKNQVTDSQQQSQVGALHKDQNPQRQINMIRMAFVKILISECRKNRNGDHWTRIASFFQKAIQSKSHRNLRF